MRSRDLSREERVFRIWNLVSSPRVGGHPSFQGPISARRHGRPLVNGLGHWSVSLQASHSSRVRRRGGVPWNGQPICVLSPWLDCARTFTARNAINDVIKSAREMPCDLDLSSWWWNWGWLDNVRTGTADGSLTGEGAWLLYGLVRRIVVMD